MGYTPIDTITVQHNGLPIHLKLQDARKLNLSLSIA